MMLLVNSAMFEINIYCQEMFQLFHCGHLVGWMPFLLANQQCQSTEGKLHV